MKAFFDELPRELQQRLKVIGVLAVILVVMLGVMHHVLMTKITVDATSADQAASPRQVHTAQTQIKQRLQRYVNQVTADKTASVYFYNLGPKSGSHAAKSASGAFYKSGNLAVSARAHVPTISASTYKLFMAGYLFSLEKSGNFAWNTTTRDGFKRMIVNSDNDFAENELDTFGLVGINQFIQNHGGYSPTFIQGQTSITTAASLGIFLRDLANAKSPFDQTQDRQYLLTLMQQQVYRTGIPAGASAAKAGTTVQDKVGFYADTNNDAGIVTLPNGQQYVLVIMTDGHQQSGLSGFPRIATITENIQKIAYGKQTTAKVKALY
ncbi:Beta-lactamase class A [Secundilactobacillus odoratitofui DSM 19909 = JCM 15043]|uniref:Beta-lactamase class A n=2 Tax=Secundilactobacillus odoratitofui TaxID=480930 RepID=A0A0R1LXZ4_9LACO|nr:serine hydrolase [Secundilactobacillus odoratitofui]KRK98499.1 Beta-lactamase class A [Secundilactobacillus odoratitofui DSM 19909 = JCM 15043]